jgi:hypothetical protein
MATAAMVDVSAVETVALELEELVDGFEPEEKGFGPDS